MNCSGTKGGVPTNLSGIRIGPYQTVFYILTITFDLVVCFMCSLYHWKVVSKKYNFLVM
jgi:hypothetical protein